MCQNETKQEAFQGTEFEIAQLSGFWDHQLLSFSTNRLEKTAHLSSFDATPRRPSANPGSGGANQRKTTASNRANNAGAPAFTAIGAACNLFGPHPMVDGGAVDASILGGGGDGLLLGQGGDDLSLSRRQGI